MKTLTTNPSIAALIAAAGASAAAPASASADAPTVLVIQAGAPTDQTYSHQDPDGWQYHWNVTRALRIAVQDPDAAVPFDLVEMGITAEHILERYVELDTAYALSDACDLTKPVLFIPWKGKALLIDGWHRTYKAAVTGVRELPALMLTPDQAEQCLMCKMPPGRTIDLRG